ncbi:lactoylglutathione lyase [Sphingobium fuliginis]|uniref:Lactoylglutathione lyase n=1 Tax=Sphingobium fuliginis (strain ATCC 27551) TaxID=336203 RepID=A0A292Z2I1_SPHSA|nr:lactoylglutathione lyase [Sphingobium fuliginis]GGA04822.1 lactoylglutathione lyase [Sphingobium fuliginis]
MLYGDEWSDFLPKYLHTMIRVTDIDRTVDFFRLLGLEEQKRIDNAQGRFTLVFLAAPGDEEAQVELTYNWPAEDGTPPEVYGGGRNFGHLAYRVENIYETCQRLMDAGVTINRPPRDGHMAFVRTPDNISIELLQDGHLDPAEPWASMPNVGAW